MWNGCEGVFMMYTKKIKINQKNEEKGGGKWGKEPKKGKDTNPTKAYSLIYVCNQIIVSFEWKER
jgi:hypothetical protein